MPKIYTANDLIRYIYRETTAQENHEIIAQMSYDLSLREEFESQLATVQSLGKAELEPHPSSVQIILEHSLQQHVA